MKYALLSMVIVLFLVGCTASCPDAQIPDGDSCCVDADASGVCDDVEVPAAPLDQAPPVIPQENLTPSMPEPLPPVENLTVTPSPDEPVVPELSVAEEYLALYEKNVKYYVFTVDDDAFGRINVWDLKDHTKYGFGEKPGQIIDGKIMSTDYLFSDDNMWTKYWRKNPDATNATLVDYIWLLDGEYSACYISEVPFYYSSTDCMFNANKTAKLIWRDVTFSAAPKMPEDWLREFVGKKAVEVKKGQMSGKYTVDHLFFANRDGTETLLYVHARYGLPVKIEILKDRKATKTYTFDNLEFNTAGMLDWDDAFFTP